MRGVRLRRVWVVVALVMVAGGLSGCSLFVDSQLTTLMTQLGQDPAQAQRYFTSGATVSLPVIDESGHTTIAVNQQLKYVLTSRFSGIFTDQGEALGEALVAATTGLRDRATAGETSARIATQLFAILGSDQTIANHMPTGLKSRLAAILADYMPDVIAAVEDRSVVLSDGYYWGNYFDSYPEGSMPYGGLITLDEVKVLLGALGQGVNADTNVQIVIAGWIPAETLSTDYLMKRFPVDLSGPVTLEASNRIGNVADFVASDLASITSPVARFAVKQPRELQPILQALDRVAAAAFLVPASPDDWSPATWEQIRTEATHAITSAASDPVVDPTASVSQLRNAIETRAGAIILDALLNSGGTSPAVLDGWTRPFPDGRTTIPPVVTQDGNGRYHADPAAPGFGAWRETNRGVPWYTITSAVQDGLFW